MYYLIIDCGTTNSRAYAVDSSGNILSKADKHVGVRDTSMTGSSQKLLDGLKEIVSLAIRKSGIPEEQFSAIFSSGMITSELGLYELPHRMAPVRIDKLSENLVSAPVTGLSEHDIPVYFVRGIKNPIPDNISDPFSTVGLLDFMRGEETQVAGLLSSGRIKPPVTVVILSSHTKFIPINEQGEIIGSLTTMSGQLREAVLSQTFVGKSVERAASDTETPDSYFDEEIIKQASQWVNSNGIIRSLMLPRFLDVLLDTEWYQRKAFFEALIASDDMLCIGALKQFDPSCIRRFTFIGLPERCRLYEYVLHQHIPGIQSSSISDTNEIDRISIDGIINIAGKAGVLK